MKHKGIKFSLRKDGTIPYLSELLPEIPSNVILDKTLPGLGATYSEIFADRNSILIEPNVPVIVGKCESQQYKQANLLGVYKGKDHLQIINYLNRCIQQRKHYKVLCTPESFARLVEAFRWLGLDPRHDAFMLMDEAHKYSEDVGYRPMIINPFDYLFECDHKAMVSATPAIQFSDPRFVQQGFQHLKLIPTFDYSQDLRLITTNSIVHSVREYLNQIGDSEPVFIFANSLELILSLMKYLKVENRSSVFCSNVGMETIKANKFRAVSDMWDETNMNQLNWLTCRYYVAFDLELPIKPHVLILTDCYFARHSMVNPSTDAVQIAGRFRNGVTSITHISNFNPRFLVRSHEQILQEIEVDRRIYGSMVGNARFATTEAVKNAFESAQKNCRYCELLNSDGTLNYFKVDKRVESELMESAYHSPKKLAEAYSSVPNFKVQHENEVCPAGDKERLKRNDLNTPKETRRIEMMNNLDLLDDTSWGISKEILEEITLEDPLLVEAYYKLGREVVEKKCQCVDSLIREQLMLIDYQKKKTGVEAIKLVKNAFEENCWYSSKDLKAGLIRIFRELDITMPGGHTPTAETICEFFDAKPHRTAKAQGYDLYACKY